MSILVAQAERKKAWWKSKAVPWQERFWMYVAKMPSGCWLWTGPMDGVGYGQMHTNDRRRSAHRISCEMANGEIPGELYVLHRCDVRACVNPDHLFLGTAGDNMRDCLSKGRHRRGETNAFKTHCPAGHEYSEQNTHRGVSGWRKCRACHAARERERRRAAR